MEYTEAEKKYIIELFKEIDRKQLAQKLQSSQRTIDQYARGLTIVSPKRALLIEEYTNGQVTAQIMRPDIFGNKKHEINERHRIGIINSKLRPILHKYQEGKMSLVLSLDKIHEVFKEAYNKRETGV
ncbi:MAG: hypothetical protein DDT22_01157 [candidate division WS2 bacterium]|nr:hypothetical protein [Bacillota bacterium]MBT9175478.1 hypothetical protein [Candidatus Lithacetigena glycinireducens]